MPPDALPRTVFFGTPEFAARSLEALLDAGAVVPLVVTQPDRPVGRHAAPQPSAVAALAASRGLPVEKPAAVRGNAGLRARLVDARPQAIAVVAYGRILPPDILSLAPLGAVNVHASLLPRHRGASPVQAAILAGDAETGVATMQMDEGLDTGPVLLERRVEIGARETAGELSERLASIGAALLVETLAGRLDGRISPRPQEGAPTLCRTIRREDALADWTLSAAELDRRLRAFTPWPGLFTFLGAERVKILDARPGTKPSDLAPGRFELVDGELLVGAGGGSALSLATLQRAGRRPVSGADFARATRLPGQFGRPT